MRRSLFILTLIFPVSVWANSDAPSPLDTWQLVENSLSLDVQAIIFQGDGEEAVPASPFITFELFKGNFYKLSIISRGDEGYRFPNFLPGPPVHTPSPSARATAGFGYYTIHCRYASL